MLTFKEYITENTYGSEHEMLTKAQRTALRKHKDYKTYVDSMDKKIYVRHGEHHDPKSSVGNYVMANSDQKHKMSVAISKQGKIFNHQIHRKHINEKGETEWHLVKNS